ncbi:DUF5995 family protein [Kitasatospora sp. NPDC005856]|uniref:DUF5995 family protein n=1 Tax=Kitasatospora sp. NPDC005856 TaxID=3154566 RepID=UPI0033ECE80C
MPDTAVDRTTAVTAEAAPDRAGIERVVRRLRRIGAGLPPADGVAVFNRLYLTVTEAVRDRLGRGCFADPRAVAELDVVFAGHYLRAVAADEAGQEPPASWRPLFALRAHPGVLPLQFALAGMNAHIQHDLPLAVVDTCRRRGCEPAVLEEDYHRINRVLAEEEAAVREQLMPGPDLLELAEPLTHLLGVWSVAAAREGAWNAAEALWELRHLPDAARAFTTALDASVGLLGRALLLPLGALLPPGPDGTPDDGPAAPRGSRSEDQAARRAADRPGTGRRAPVTAAAARLPEARSRAAGGTVTAGAAGLTGAAGATGAGGDQAQLECSGLPSA